MMNLVTRKCTLASGAGRPSAPRAVSPPPQLSGPTASMRPRPEAPDPPPEGEGAPARGDRLRGSSRRARPPAPPRPAGPPPRPCPRRPASQLPALGYGGGGGENRAAARRRRRRRKGRLGRVVAGVRPPCPGTSLAPPLRTDAGSPGGLCPAPESRKPITAQLELAGLLREGAAKSRAPPGILAASPCGPTKESLQAGGPAWFRTGRAGGDCQPPGEGRLPVLSLSRRRLPPGEIT